MKKLILAFLIIPSLLLAGNVFTSSGDPDWFKEALGLDEINGFEILASENSSLFGRKYWSYKLKVLDSKHIFEDLNLKGLRKIQKEENIESIKKVIPTQLLEFESAFHTRKKFMHYYSDIIIITMAEEKEDRIIHVVFCGEPLVIKLY